MKMRRKPKTAHLTPWKKGQSGNPLGGQLHNKEFIKIKKLTKDEVAELGSIILHGDVETLKEIRKSPASSVLQVWMASVALRAIQWGDVNALNNLLDRIVGKVREQVQHTGLPGVTNNYLLMSEDEIRDKIRHFREVRELAAVGGGVQSRTRTDDSGST